MNEQYHFYRMFGFDTPQHRLREVHQFQPLPLGIVPGRLTAMDRNCMKPMSLVCGSLESLSSKAATAAANRWSSLPAILRNQSPIARGERFRLAPRASTAT